MIAGHEVLLVQATRQFEKMTGRIIPAALMAGQLKFHGRTETALERSANRDSSLCRGIFRQDVPGLDRWRNGHAF